MKVNYLLIGIIFGSLLLFVFVYPHGVNKWVSVPNVPFRLGLDLLGGTHLVYQADLSKSENKSDAMQGVRDVIERRVNFFGVAEPLVQISGQDRLIVELAGISDVTQAIKLIGETPFLEFKETKADTQAILDAQQKGQRLNEDPLQSTRLN